MTRRSFLLSPLMAALPKIKKPLSWHWYDDVLSKNVVFLPKGERLVSAEENRALAAFLKQLRASATATAAAAKDFSEASVRVGQSAEQMSTLSAKAK